MYIEHSIGKLSKNQISKLLNGHSIRIKHGNAHKLSLSAEQNKKLMKAMKAQKGMTITLDPFQIETHQHLRGPPKKSVKMAGSGLLDGIVYAAASSMLAEDDKKKKKHKKGKGGFVGALKDAGKEALGAATDRAVGAINGSDPQYKQSEDESLEGSGMIKKRPEEMSGGAMDLYEKNQRKTLRKMVANGYHYFPPTNYETFLRALRMGFSDANGNYLTAPPTEKQKREIDAKIKQYELRVGRGLQGKGGFVGALKDAGKEALGAATDRAVGAIKGSDPQYNQSEDMEGGKINRRKKFDQWFKSIGSKFKTLNHNLQPVKRAASDRAASYITHYNNPTAYLNDAANAFDESNLDTAISVGKKVNKMRKPKAVIVPELQMAIAEPVDLGANLPDVPSYSTSYDMFGNPIEDHSKDTFYTGTGMKKRGRPKKPVAKKPVGRPKKPVAKKPVGRPKKVVPKKRGRPKKGGALYPAGSVGSGNNGSPGGSKAKYGNMNKGHKFNRYRDNHDMFGNRTNFDSRRNKKEKPVVYRDDMGREISREEYIAMETRKKYGNRGGALYPAGYSAESSIPVYSV
jgi:hypothetical protein